MSSRKDIVIKDINTITDNKDKLGLQPNAKSCIATVSNTRWWRTQKFPKNETGRPNTPRSTSPFRLRSWQSAEIEDGEDGEGWTSRDACGKLSYTCISIFLYADDIILLSPSVGNLLLTLQTRMRLFRNVNEHTQNHVALEMVIDVTNHVVV